MRAVQIETTVATIPPVEERRKSNYHFVLWTMTPLAVVALVAIVATEIFAVFQEAVEGYAEYSNQSSLEELKLQVITDHPHLADLVEILEKMNILHPKRLLQRVKMTSEDEKEFFLYLTSNFEVSETVLEEILKGAYVRLEDGGDSYALWKKQFSAKERISSHPSDDKQYGLQGKLIKELLFSKIGNQTWFQLENQPTSLGHMIRHGCDYLRYKYYQANQGPWGQSHYKDNAPLFLRKKQIVEN